MFPHVRNYRHLSSYQMFDSYIYFSFFPFQAATHSKKKKGWNSKAFAIL